MQGFENIDNDNAHLTTGQSKYIQVPNNEVNSSLKENCYQEKKIFKISKNIDVKYSIVPNDTVISSETNNGDQKITTFIKVSNHDVNNTISSYREKSSQETKRFREERNQNFKHTKVKNGQNILSEVDHSETEINGIIKQDNNYSKILNDSVNETNGENNTHLLNKAKYKNVKCTKEQNDPVTISSDSRNHDLEGSSLINVSNQDDKDFMVPNDIMNSSGSENHKLETKLFKRRWLILIIFVLYAAGSFMQWFQYSIISNVVEKYYSVSSWAVKLTSMIFMLTYLPLAFPVSYLMDQLDLRASALIGVIGTAVGSWVKVFSVTPDGFSLTFAGQTIIALSQLFIINVPPKLAAVWFGESEVSTACSIAIWGSQFGIASGFFLSPLLVVNSESTEAIGHDLYYIFLYIAIFTSIMAIAVTTVFQAQPDLPPSHAQALLLQTPVESASYLVTLRKLLLNRDFIFLFTSNGINNGCFSAMSTMLNQIFLFYFPEGEVDPGTVGVVIVVGGMIGSVFCGYVMDKTKKYKEVAFAVYLLAALTMIGYTFALMKPQRYVIYTLAWILGFFLLGYTPVGYEFASELTYPESEVTVATILNTMNMLAGILFTVIFDAVLEGYGEFWSNIAAAMTLFLGTALTVAIRPILKRQHAQQLRSHNLVKLIEINR